MAGIEPLPVDSVEYNLLARQMHKVLVQFAHVGKLRVEGKSMSHGSSGVTGNRAIQLRQDAGPISATSIFQGILHGPWLPE